MPLDELNVVADRPYPNIIPENNQRLPDALTIKHGPARLLAQTVIEGDRLARRMGVRLRLRHDFDELVYLNRQQVAAGKWLTIPDAYNPECADLNSENAFWISGENDRGEIILTDARRIYSWTGTSLAEQIRTAWYGRDLGQPCIVTAEAAKMITGVVVCAGAAWVRPDFRGQHFSHLMPRIAKAYACARWPIEWAIGFISKWNVEKGLANNYGQQNLSYSITYPGSAWGEVVLAYTPVADVYEDLANFVSAKLSRADTVSAATLASISLAHEVTRTSSDGVFQGSSSRS